MTATADDWKTRWASKVATPERAIRAIARGQRILIGSGAAEPCTLVDALVTHGGHLEGNDIVHLLTLGPAPYVKPELAGRFRHAAFFIGANVREAVSEGRADFLPVFLSEIPQLIRSRRTRVDVALVQVSPPDRHGFVSLGVSVDIVRAAVESASLVLAEVNPRMPRTLGDSFFPVSRIDWLVPVDAPLLEREPEPLDEVDHAIGRNVASLVPDGATIQTGIGKIPDAVMASLANHRDLGVHTEMFSDGVMDLARAGVINGRRKSLLPGKLVTSFVMGSARLYEWVHENPVVEMRPSEFTNDPFTIARNEAMVSINACLAVDLTGQVASDTLLGRFFSGIGGQVDFVRGASRSKGGKAILALRSTAKGGTLSRIQPAFEEGAGIVTSRGDVRYVVTEHGIADLWGRSVRERALALIGIAHPDFRGELLAAAKARRYVFPDQAIPRADPWAASRTATLPGGESLTLRPLALTDERTLRDLLERLPDAERARRLLPTGRASSPEEIQQLVDLSDERNMALVAERPAGELVGCARYDVEPATRLAAVALVIRDGWQGRGVEAALLDRVREVVRARGLAGLAAAVGPSEGARISFLEAGFLPAGERRLELRFGAEAEPRRGD